MSNPLPYLVRMLLFLAVVAGIGWVLHKDLLRVFNNTPILNTVIVGVLVLGIFFVFRQVLILWPEVNWLRRYIHREESAPPPRSESVNLLAPLATMLGEQERIRLSPTATRAVLDGIATRLDARRELARATSLSSAGLPGSPQGIPAYVEALLERNTEGVDSLVRGLQRVEDSRLATAASNATLIERLAALAETTRAQQNLLARFTELSIELRGAVARLSDRATASEADREAMLSHQASIEGHLGRLLEETVRSRAALAEELRGVAGKLGD